MTDKSSDEPFLSRWARRKQDARAGDRAETAHAQPAPLQPDGRPPDPAPPAEPELDLSKLPKIEDLTADSDIAAFLDKRVPAALRNAALSRIWTLDPTIRDFIEVAENQWNWNVPGGAPFYELMEPGTGASTVFADATSAIARPLSPQAEPSQSASDKVSDTEKDNLETCDQPDTQNVALPSNEIPNPNEVTSETLDIAATSLAQNREAAPQQIDVLHDFAPRRRHGGALPS